MNKEDFLKKHNLEEITENDGFVLDIIYSTDDNFVHKKLYEYPICILRKKTKEKLIEANKDLNKLGFKIKIWDAFRPIKFQKYMWECFPDERFVTNPDKGNSIHCKGSAVDVTLCTLDNKEVRMPTEFDHFGIESFRKNYNMFDKEIVNNVTLLENIMKKHGFIPFETEWWHFNDCDDYDIIYDMFE